MPAKRINPDDPRIRHKEILYDKNGNQKEIIEKVGEVKTSLRKNLWDEENRLIAVDLKPDEPTGHPIAIYTYNAAGERVVRYNYNRTDVASNAKEISQVVTANVMIYPNGLLMAKIVKDKKDTLSNRLAYTKHYYIGSERISAKIGILRDSILSKKNYLLAEIVF